MGLHVGTAMSAFDNSPCYLIFLSIMRSRGISLSNHVSSGVWLCILRQIPLPHLPVGAGFGLAASRLGGIFDSSDRRFVHCTSVITPVCGTLGIFWAYTLNTPQWCVGREAKASPAFLPSHAVSTCFHGNSGTSRPLIYRGSVPLRFSPTLDHLF